MLDDSNRYDLDSTNLAGRIEALPGSYRGPKEVLEGPYGVVGFGEAAWAAQVGREWIDAAVVAGGSQFVLEGGLDFGEAAAAGLLAQLAEARLVRVGFAMPQPSRELDQEAEDAPFYHPVAASPLSSYDYLQCLSYATGRSNSALQADEALQQIAERCRVQVPTELNPAKTLAWQLWTRTPVLIASRADRAQVWAWQVLLARLAKSMSIPLDRDALVTLASGFEARHEQADGHVVLILGAGDEEMQLAREVAETRFEEVIEVPAFVEAWQEHFFGTSALSSSTLGPEAGSPELEEDNLRRPRREHGYVSTLAQWYFGLWVSYYLALLYGVDPSDSSVLVALNEV